MAAADLALDIGDYVLNDAQALSECSTESGPIDPAASAGQISMNVCAPSALAAKALAGSATCRAGGKPDGSEPHATPNETRAPS